MQQTGPMSGIRIVELSTVVTAALAATLLAEQGASVIKIEPPGIGDTLRHLGSSRAGVSAMFANCNRGKRSVALNLKTDEGVEIVRKLATQADVLISNYRPGVLERLGLGSETLRKDNPGLIYVAISGFGSEGPLATAPAYDHVIQALSGFTDVQGEGATFDMVKTFICDEVTAYTACQATTAALFQRSRDGEGQHIDLSMLDSALYFLWPAGMADHTYLGDGVQPRMPLKATYRTYETRDGYVAMTPFNDAHFAAVFRIIKREDLLQDERYATMVGRAQHMLELFELFQAAFRELDSDTICNALREADVPCNPCLDVVDAIAHAQVEACGTVEQQEHALLGSLRSPAHPARFGGQRRPALAPLGALGEHTEEVLAELGYDAQSLSQLRDAGVTG